MMLKKALIGCFLIFCLSVSGYIIGYSNEDNVSAWPYARRLSDIPGWKRAEELKAVQEVNIKALDSGVEITVKKILIDITRTFIICEFDKEHENWEILKASLISNSGGKYQDQIYDCLEPKGNNILIFQPIGDNIKNLTLTIEKIGVPRSDGYIDDDIIWYNGYTQGSGNVLNVREELKTRSTEEEKANKERHDRDTINRYYKNTTNGHWKFTFPISTEHVKKYASVKDLEKEIKLFYARIILKRLVMGLSEWVLEYDIEATDSFSHDLLIKSDGKVFHDKNDFGYYTWKNIKGNEVFIFDPPDHSEHMAITIGSASEINLPSPLEFKINKDNLTPETRHLFNISLRDFKFKCSLSILKISDEKPDKLEYLVRYGLGEVVSPGESRK